VREADRCTKPGEIGALLRREGLYSSHLVTWRAARDRGELEGLSPKPRGPKATPPDPRDKHIAAQARETTGLLAKAWPIKGPEHINEIDWREWDRLLEEESTPFIRYDLGRGFARGKVRLVIESPISFDVFRPEVVEFVREHAYKFTHAVNAITRADLQRVLSTGLARGDTLSEITDSVQEKYRAYERYRAERVARTETGRARFAGQNEAWRESGVVTGIHWITQPGATPGGVCVFCEEMGERFGPEGQATPMGQAFLAEGDNIEVESRETGDPVRMALNYSDTPHPPLHPNCACDIEPVIEGE